MIYKLSKYNKRVTDMFLGKGITVYIENNARLTPLNHTPEDLEIIFRESPATEFILDISHFDNYEHLQKLINVKYPKMLHIADRRFSSNHEHLPIGEGEIDFELVFSEYLSGFNGKVILEISEDENVVVDSVEKIRKIIKRINHSSKLL